MRRTRIRVVDNYDSFVYTLVGYLQQLGAETTVVRNDDVTLAEAVELAAARDAVLISPGPGAAAAAATPMLGICLGHQALAEAYGGTVTHAPELMHGKTSLVRHEGTDVFSGLPSPVTATRYHSLAAVADTIPAELQVTARTDSGIIMGLRHTSAPLSGVQFHPESVLTEGGYQMLGNWLEGLGLAGAAAHAATLSPLMSTAADAPRQVLLP